MDYEYDVALSFAGEDRTFVEECANIMAALELRVFYDSYEEAELWGKDLYVFLADIYSKKSKYTIIFVSDSYKRKRWTKHEFKFACERMFKEEREYILPVLLDDTLLDGIPETMGYLTNKTPYEIAVMVAHKVNPQIDVKNMIVELAELLPSYSISIDGTEVILCCEEEDYEGKFPLALMMELYKQDLLFELFVLPAIVPN